MRNFKPNPLARRYRSAERRADAERAEGIPDREPITDCRDAIELDLTSHGGKRWRIEPRLGYASCRLMDGEAVALVGTLKQILRHLSRVTVHTTSPRNLQ